MSIRLMSKVYQMKAIDLISEKGRRVLGSTVKAVLLALADHSSDDGENVYPSVELLSDKTGFSCQTVITTLSALRKSRVIISVGTSRHGTNEYKINIDSEILNDRCERYNEGKATLPQEKIQSKATLSDEVKPLYDESKAALLKPLVNHHIKQKAAAPQISSFSYFGDSKIIEVVDAFNHYFKIDPPFKGGSGYTKWIKDAKTFLSICGDGNIKYIMADVYKAWKGEDFTVYDIGSIVKLARVVIARRKDVEKLIDANGNVVEMI
jgi:hypothetical protein